MPDDSAAQPIIDYFTKGIKTIQKYTGTAPPEQKPDPPKPDDPWHADMVKRANDDFRRKAEEDQKTTPVFRKDIIRKPVARKR